jgi:uncharacterized membrane protein YphA (DoxX/SURF4 family)
MKSRRLTLVSLSLALIFGVSGIAKLVGADAMVDQFQRWGYSQSFMLAVGTFELLGAIGLLVPKIASVSALCLILLMIGAVYTLLFRDFAPVAILPLIMIVPLAYVAKRRLESRQSWVLRQRELF